jgi:hypothetical protein
LNLELGTSNVLDVSMTMNPYRRTIVLGLLAAGLAGCGLSAYEERLAKTDQRNRYFAKLDSTLDPFWNHPGYQLWIRPPKSLRSIPAPVKPKDGEMPPDARQEFQGVPLDLPGVIQAWDGTLPTAGGGTGPYRLYLLGNHSRFLRNDEAGRSSDPKQFFADLEAMLQNLFGVTLPEGDQGRGDQNNAKYRLSIPTSEQFVIPKPFQAINFVPPTPEQTPFHAWLFEYTTGQIQFAVLMLTPPNPTTDVRQALTTALETLQVSPQAPGLQANSPAGGARPGGGF